MCVRALLMTALLAFPSIAVAQDRVGALERACEKAFSSHQRLAAELSAMKINPYSLCRCAAPIIIGSGLNKSDAANFVRSGHLNGAAINVLLRINRSCVAR